MGILLWVAAIFLSLIIVPGGIIFGIIYGFYRKHVGHGFRNANLKFFKMAIGIDILGNVVCEEFLNATLILNIATHRFGAFGETISEVLGWNLLNGTLTKKGHWLARQLDKFEKNHCLKAINYGVIEETRTIWGIVKPTKVEL